VRTIADAEQHEAEQRRGGQGLAGAAARPGTSDQVSYKLHYITRSAESAAVRLCSFRGAAVVDVASGANTQNQGKGLGRRHCHQLLAAFLITVRSA
jgi:hypothetical protein